MAVPGGTRKRAASRKHSRGPDGDPPGDGGPDEATAFIAENVAELAALARRHRLDLLVHLLGMTQLEAEERLRGRRKLS